MSSLVEELSASHTLLHGVKLSPLNSAHIKKLVPRAVYTVTPFRGVIRFPEGVNIISNEFPGLLVPYFPNYTSSCKEMSHI